MSPNAFDPPYGFVVDSSRYGQQRQHDYARWPTGLLRRPIRVSVQMQWMRGFVSRGVYVVVDSLADFSTLSDEGAKALRVNRRLRRGESLDVRIDRCGRHLVGVWREITVLLGCREQIVDCLVAPHPDDLRLDSLAGLLGSPPEENVLCMMEFLERHLLCFDSERLYAFSRNPTVL